jgi:hypothetical protein
MILKNLYMYANAFRPWGTPKIYQDAEQFDEGSLSYA